MEQEHFSYSQLTEFERCPYSYFLSRDCGVKTRESAFTQAGSLMHNVLACWAARVFEIPELPGIFRAEWPKYVTEAFPRYLGPEYEDKLLEQCLEYLKGFDGFPGYDIVDAEKKLSTSIAGENFVGVIDLLLKDRDGRLVIVDHKSAGRLRSDMWRQLHLYSRLVKDEYGEYPAALQFNLFKTGKTTVQAFDESRLKETMAWAEGMIQRIREADITDFMNAKSDVFFCRNLCGCREVCEIAA